MSLNLLDPFLLEPSFQVVLDGVSIRPRRLTCNISGVATGAADLHLVPGVDAPRARLPFAAECTHVVWRGYPSALLALRAYPAFRSIISVWWYRYHKMGKWMVGSQSGARGSGRMMNQTGETGGAKAKENSVNAYKFIRSAVGVGR